jgi:hypothetical protein
LLLGARCRPFQARKEDNESTGATAAVGAWRLKYPRVMSFFRRAPRDRAPSTGGGETLEAMEQSPALLDAERRVNRLPPPPPSPNAYLDAILGPSPQIVVYPDDEGLADP